MSSESLLPSKVFPDHVQRARDTWVPVADPDLLLDAGEPVAQNLDLLRTLLDHARSN